MEQLNHKPINGRECSISWAQKSAGNGVGLKTSGGTPGTSGVGTSLFVKNLPRNIDANGLKVMFEPHGALVSSELVFDVQGNSRGFGFVQYENTQSADAAKKALDGSLVASHKITVEYYVANKRAAPKEEEVNWTNVFFKNTPAEFTQDQLTALFAPFGTITSAVVMAPTTQSEDGSVTTFGFVNFEKHEDAVNAVGQINGMELDGRPVYCGRAQKKAEREENLKRLHARRENQTRGGGSGAGTYSNSSSSGPRRGGAPITTPTTAKFQDGLNLFIGNLDESITEEMLSKEFSRMGTIQSMRVITDGAGTPKGYAFVCYATQQEAQKAIAELNNTALPGSSDPHRQMIVRLHEPRKQTQPSHHQSSYTSRGGRGGRQNGNSHHHHQATQKPTKPVEKKTDGATSSSAATSAAPAAAPAATSAAPADTPKPTTEMLSKLSDDDQKMAIGNYLYQFVSKTQPDRAGKIVGMILHGHDTKALHDVMNSEEKLNAKVKEAVTLLDKQ